MLKFFLKNLSWFFLAVLLVFCVWLIIHRNSTRSNQARTFKSETLALWLPFQETVSWLITFPENTLNAVRELRTLRQEVNRLQMDNQSLRLELSNHKSIESELNRLQQVLELKSKLPHKARIARIIARDPSTWNRSFIIDIGSEDGVLVDSPAISEQGIVGRVVDVAPGHSRVLMTTDSNSSVSAIDSRSRVTGIVQGTGLNQLKYAYVEGNEDVQKDDVIVSSGLGGAFPKGYVIGSVLKKTQTDNGLNVEIEVAPAVDFASLDYVFILPPIDVFQ